MCLIRFIWWSRITHFNIQKLSVFLSATGYWANEKNGFQHSFATWSGTKQFKQNRFSLHNFETHTRVFPFENTTRKQTAKLFTNHIWTSTHPCWPEAVIVTSESDIEMWAFWHIYRISIINWVIRFPSNLRHDIYKLGGIGIWVINLFASQGFTFPFSVVIC